MASMGSFPNAWLRTTVPVYHWQVPADRKDRRTMMVVGIDSHKDSLAACAIDRGGRARAQRSFANTVAGHLEVLEWVGDLGAGRVAIEGSGSYGRPLALVLLAAQVEVVEVPPQMTAGARRSQRSRHKSDPGDALQIARVGAREDDLPRPRPDGVVEDLRALVFYRREQAISLTREANRLHADLALIRPGYKQRITTKLTRRSTLSQVTRLISADRSVRASIARLRIRTMRGLISSIADLDTHIGELVTQTGAGVLTDIYGIGTVGAGEILAEVGDPTKYPTKAKFAMANGTAPLQASSGRTVRHRLNRGGNRRLNSTIHIAALTQIRRHGTEGRVYYDRLQTRGKTKKEALRILKRRISDRIWTHLQHIPTTPELT